MCRKEARIQEQFGHPWTNLDTAPSAPKPQVAGSIPVPPARKIILGFSVSHPCNLKDTPCLQRRIPQI